jgi:hypothetical protein
MANPVWMWAEEQKQILRDDKKTRLEVLVQVLRTRPKVTMLRPWRRS